MKASALCFRLLRYVIFAALLTALPAFANIPLVTLTPNPPAPQKVGTPVTFTATIINPQQGHTYDYQFSAITPIGNNDVHNNQEIRA